MEPQPGGINITLTNDSRGCFILIFLELFALARRFVTIDVAFVFTIYTLETKKDNRKLN